MPTSKRWLKTAGWTTWRRSCTGRSTAPACPSPCCWTPGWPRTARAAMSGRACSPARSRAASPWAHAPGRRARCWTRCCCSARGRGATGHIHFSMAALMQDRDGIATLLQMGPYAQPALVPATPWLDASHAARAHAARGRRACAPSNPAPGEAAARWAVWRRAARPAWRFEVLAAANAAWTRQGADLLAVSAVDARRQCSSARSGTSSCGLPDTAMTLLRTEQPHPAHAALDTYDTAALVQAFVADQAQAALAVQAAAPALAQAVDAAVPRLRAGGRIVYVGAGTSGRLGVLDSVELNPTFSWPPERAPALLAGGLGAMFLAVEGAEDDREQGAPTCWRCAHGAGRGAAAGRVGRHALCAGVRRGRARSRRADRGHGQQPRRAAGRGVRDRHRAGHRARGHQRQHAAEGRHGAEDRAQHLQLQRDGAAEQGLRQPDGGPARHQRQAGAACAAPDGARHRGRRSRAQAPRWRPAASA
jgi:hypothetical protein